MSLPKYTYSVPDIDAMKAREVAGQPAMPLTHKTEVFLSGKDCYALRCACLHEGDFDITAHAVRDALERFVFVIPTMIVVHCNRINQFLQLQVDLFCEDICKAIEDWLQARGADPSVE